MKTLNAGNYDAVPAELAKWVNAGGRKIPGLVNRRASQAGLWARGAFMSSNNVSASLANAPLLTRENIAVGAGALGSVATAASSPGPLKWALAIVMVVGFAVAL